ncbi:putative phenylalanine aminotransferase [Tersicoccus solisilvae]|uniref:Aromatic amino acid aminotransferase n=1 Tax=Tersicoccus solisilvae TaxID=1882339 RepID=A0ABQ1NLC5_9MICC|nr:histidinol-phosphate transaminase [Tersicoccus solisilvae]GGC80035.1 putative phenylalanine aminotransferase [Tersicoccus solisilvae]
MTSIDPNAAPVPAAPGTDDAAPAPAPGVRPRAVLDALPRYAAGRPATVVEGLQSFKLSSNENPLPPIPAVLDAIRDTTAINRYPDAVSTRLRERLATYLEVPAEDIVTGGGSLGALNQVLATYAGQNDFGAPDEVVYAWRSFEAYPISVGLSGATSVRVPLLPDGRHDLAAMAAAVTENTRVVLLCTPNNPTGPILTHDEVVDFLGRVPSHVVVVLDEAYLEFVRDPAAVDGLALYRAYPNLVLLRTFSKAHGLAGLRVGYTVAQPVITENLRVSAVPFAVSSLAETAAITSLDHLDEVLARVDSLVAERDRVVAALTEQGWDLPQAEGNFVWLRLGERCGDFAAAAERQALSVRRFGDEGVRVSIGEVDANTRFIDLCRSFGA